MSPKARVQKRLYYKIGEACKALEIQPYVLRYWETEFPPLSPHKSRSGQRVYSEKELGVIRRIKELLYEEGYTIAGAKKKLEAELASGLLPHEPEEGEDAGGLNAGDGGATAAASGAGSEGPGAAAERDQARPAAGRAGAARPAAEPAPRPAALPAQQSLLLDTQAAERVESMRQGIHKALGEARELLVLLASKSPSRQ